MNYSFLSRNKSTTKSKEAVWALGKSKALRGVSSLFLSYSYATCNGKPPQIGQQEMTRSPTLDVLIPHYDDPLGLEGTLTSIRLQDWQGRIRVIIADDGSSGDNFARAQEIAGSFESKSYHHIRVLRSKENKGRPHTRNELLDASDASHIAWLDAGDLWHASKITHQFSYLTDMSRSGQDLSRTWITCDYDWVENEESRRVNQNVSGNQFESLIVGTHLRAYLWTILGTRDSFVKTGYFDERLLRLQDLDYFLRFVRGGGKIEKPTVSDTLATYFKSDIGRNARSIYDSSKIIVEKNLPELINHPSHFKRGIKYKYIKLASRFAANNDDALLKLKYDILAAKEKPMHTIRQLSSRIKNRLTS